MPPFRIIAIGDSLTYGYPFGKPLSWVELTSKEIQIPILNQGVNGDTLGDMLKRLNVHVMDLHPEICILLGGSNDIYHGVDLETMKSNFNQLLERLLEQHIRPVIGLPPPVQDAMYEKILTKFRNWLKKQAKASKLTVIDFYRGFLDKKKKLVRANLEDGVHPSYKGYQTMAQAATKVLQELV